MASVTSNTREDAASRAKSLLAIDLPKTGAKGFEDAGKDEAINCTKTYRLVAVASGVWGGLRWFT
jgi:hypothetical protein